LHHLIINIKKITMSTLLKAMQTNDSLTENGMATNSSSLNHCVDLFFQIGAMRGQDKQRLINAFTKAFAENPLNAMRLLFWARDVRGGAGERQIFRDIVEYLAKNRTETLGKNLHLISEYGRWDDVLALVGTPLETQALDLVSSALNRKDGLCAKWMPRPNVTNREKKRWASAVRKHMGLTPKEYRKLLAENSNTVEKLMCAKEFTKIDYSKLPSKAMSDLMKAFSRNDLERFQAYLASLEKGEVKINAGAVYPYDIVKNLKHGSARGANAQWTALPNYMEGNNEFVLPVVDVSGSMSCPAGGNPNVTCMDVAISLGLYISERNVGPFQDAFVTFSESPKLQILKGSLEERYNQLQRADWDMSTNLEAVFKLILKKAKESNVPQSEMPTMVLVLSDMEFNSAVRGRSWNPTAQQMIESMYAEAGYKTPKVVYWNIQSRGDNNKPVHFDTNGTALVSGFSPALLTNLLAGKDMTPMSMMLSVIDSERYSPVTI
jgi:hypothetical protein